MQRSRFLAAAAAAAASIAPLRALAAPPANDAEAAVRAYIFAYPLVLLAVMQQVQVAITGRNRFLHTRQFALPEEKRERPNLDVLRSSAFVDLAFGPVILTIPDTHNHFFSCTVTDAWTNVCADPGTHTIGENTKQLLFVGPGQTANVPDGVTRVDAPTNVCWFVNRVAVRNPGDISAAHTLQDAFTIVPFPGGTALPGASRTSADTAVPAQMVAELSADRFFTTAARALSNNPPPAVDGDGLADLMRLGIVTGMPVDSGRMPRERRSALRAAPAAGQTILAARAASGTSVTSTGWQRPDRELGHFGSDDLLRARTALRDAGAPLPEDAVAFTIHADGTHPAQLVFAAGDIPPQDGFWSLTLYGTDGRLIENPQRKYVLHSTDPFVHNPDGTLILALTEHPPSDPDRAAANWLAVPAGPYTLTLRLYAPRAAAIDGRWIPPALTAPM